MDIVDENVEARNDNIDNPNRDNANDDNFEAPDDNEIVNLGPEIEEAIINNEDNEVIRDPNFTIGDLPSSESIVLEKASSTQLLMRFKASSRLFLKLF